MYSCLKDNYDRVKKEIADACLLSCRKVEEVKLLAVSKFQSIQHIEIIAEQGQKDFGENYFQEWQAKNEFFSARSAFNDLRWHMTGHLQTRKGSHAAGHFALLHTLDSKKLAMALQKTLLQQNLVQPTLIEVNIANEPQKSGVPQEELEKFSEFVLRECGCVQLCGLMCIPPYSDAGERSRPYFSLLRKLRDKLESSLGIKLPELSMGMSADFRWAIAEGATIVRIGTAIFGHRQTALKKAN